MTFPKHQMGPPSQTVESLVVRVPRACELLAVSKKKLYRLMHAREIKGYRDGGSRKIEVASIKNYIARKIAEEE